MPATVLLNTMRVVGVCVAVGKNNKIDSYITLQPESNKIVVTNP